MYTSIEVKVVLEWTVRIESGDCFAKVCLNLSEIVVRLLKFLLCHRTHIPCLEFCPSCRGPTRYYPFPLIAKECAAFASVQLCFAFQALSISSSNLVIAARRARGVAPFALC